MIHDSSFRRWVLGMASEQEVQFWDSWVQQSARNRQKAIRAQSNIMGYAIDDPSVQDTDAEWIRMEKKLKAHHINKNAASKKGVSFSRFNLLMRVAAVLIISLGIGSAVFYISEQTEQQPVVENATILITTGFGEKKKMSLSDGSQIILNANSSISYNPHNKAGEDFVVSLHGEALFAVTRRKTSEDPKFTVKTRDGKVTVLGTRFVVNTRSKLTQVVLEEGLVSMNPLNDAPENPDKTIYLRPGELAQFASDTDTVFIKKINPEVYTSWTTHKLVFDETPLAEIGQRIEQTFGIEVVFADSSLKERRVSGSIENSGLQVIIRGLSETLMISTEIKNKQVIFGSIRQE